MMRESTFLDFSLSTHSFCRDFLRQTHFGVEAQKRLAGFETTERFGQRDRWNPIASMVVNIEAIGFYISPPLSLIGKNPMEIIFQPPPSEVLFHISVIFAGKNPSPLIIRGAESYYWEADYYSAIFGKL